MRTEFDSQSELRVQLTHEGVSVVDQGIYVIIDGSGSMSGVKHDVTKGINEFIKEQQDDIKGINEVVQFSLTVFDTNVTEVYIKEDMSLVQPVTVKQTWLGGGTALLDAMGKTLANAELDGALRNIVVIYTDGEENSSYEYSADQIRDMVERLDKTGRWQFVYLGAEFEDFKTDTAYASLSAVADSMNTSKGNVDQTWAAVSNTTRYHRHADANQYNTIKSRGGLIATAAADAGVDWDAVDEAVQKATKELEKTSVTEPGE